MAVTLRKGWPEPDACPECGETLNVCVDPPLDLMPYAPSPSTDVLLPHVSPSRVVYLPRSEARPVPFAPPAPRPAQSPPPVKPDGRIVQYYSADNEICTAVLQKVNFDGTADLKVLWRFGQYLNLSSVPFTTPAERLRFSDTKAAPESEAARGCWSFGPGAT